MHIVLSPKGSWTKTNFASSTVAMNITSTPPFDTRSLAGPFGGYTPMLPQIAKLSGFLELACCCRCRGLLGDVHGKVGHWGLLEIMFTQCQRESVWLLPKNILCYLGSMRHNFRQNHVEAAFDTSWTGHRTELWPHQLRVTWQDSSPERKQEDKQNRTVQTNGHQRFGTWEWCMFQKWGFDVI